MSELPKGWVNATLKDTCSVVAGYGFPERLQGRPEGDLPFFKVGDISEAWKRGENVLAHAEHYLSYAEADELRAKPFPPGTTVFAKIGAAIGLNRRAMLSVPSLVDNNVMGLVPDTGLIRDKYLFHYACTLRLMEYAQATTVPSVRKSDVEAVRIPIAPKDEQDRIVAEIEKQFTRLDAATMALKRVQANLKRYRASVLKAACEGRLVPTEAELARKEGRDYEPAGELLKRILRERRTQWEADTLVKMIVTGKHPADDRWKYQYKEPAAPDTTNLPELPEGWCWVSIDQIVAEEKYSLAIGPFGSNLKVADYREDGVPLIFVKNIRSRQFDGDGTRFISTEKAKELKAHMVSSGDLLVTKMGDPPGDACSYPQGFPDAIITADCIKIRIHDSLEASQLFSYFIESDTCRRQILDRTMGVAQRKVSLARVRDLALPLPPKDEQRRLLAAIDQQFSGLDSTAPQFQKLRRRAEVLRQAILKQAFSGMLISQDLTEEPATVLLERIRTGRIAAPKQKSARAQRKELAHA